MPRNGWQKPESDQRLSDHLTIAMLTRAYPEPIVEAVIADTGRAQQRQRLLPARVVLYHVMAMALFSEASYEEVMRRLLEGLAWQQRWTTSWQVPTKAAIFKARTRLGIEPLAELYRRTVRPLTGPSTAGASYRGRPIVTVDRLTLNVSGMAHSDSHAGRHPSESSSTLPITGLVEAVSHAVLAIALDGTPIEDACALTDELQPNTLYLLDDQTGSLEFASAIAGHDSDLLWATERSTALTDPDTKEVLADGTTLVRLAGPDRDGAPPRMVRVLEPSLSNAGELTGEPSESANAAASGQQRMSIGRDCRLITTLLDPTTAPADELRDLYAGRATILGSLEDLRVHQRSPTLVPHSQSVDGISQELYGVLLAHYAIRSLLSRPLGDDVPPGDLGAP